MRLTLLEGHASLHSLEYGILQILPAIFPRSRSRLVLEGCRDEGWRLRAKDELIINLGSKKVFSLTSCGFLDGFLYHFQLMPLR